MIRSVRVRMDVTRNGVKHTELRAADAPIISMNREAAIKTSLSGTFAENTAVDWLQDELKPVIIVDGIEHELGIFRPATVTESRSASSKSVKVEAYDRCWLVQAIKTSYMIHLSSGSNYLTVIKSLLSEAGIALVLETPTSLTLRADREDWQAGTDYLTIINQLLDEINYSQLWFNWQGYAVLQPKSAVTAANVVRSYNQHDVSSMMIQETTKQLDMFNAPNVFVCICSNPDDSTPMTATAENNNPASPLSIVRRGIRIVEVTQVDNIASQSALNEYAQLRCMKSMLPGETVTIKTALMWDCGVNDLVALIHQDASGLYEETGWRMNLKAGGEMTHTLEKAVNTS